MKSSTAICAIFAAVLTCTAQAQDVSLPYTLVTMTFQRNDYLPIAPVVATVGTFADPVACIHNAQVIGDQLDGPHHRQPIPNLPQWAQSRVVLQCLPAKVPDTCGVGRGDCWANDMPAIVVFLGE